MIIFHLQRIIYLLFIVFSSYIFIPYFSPPQDNWVIWSGFLLSLITAGHFFIHRLEAIFVTTLACLAVAWFAEYANTSLASLSVYLFIVTTYCVYLSQRYPAHAYSFLLVSLFAILASFSPLTINGYHQAIFSIALGAMIVGIGQFIFSYHFAKHHWLSIVMTTLESMKKLNKEIFSCLLQSEYPENNYLFERRLHTEKEKVMKGLVLLSERKPNKLEEAISTKLNILFDTMQDYAQLRRRITDYTVLGICTSELASIEKLIEATFSLMQKSILQKNYQIDTHLLSTSIQRLEDNYQQVLQVTSPEPIAFLLFISALKSFCEEAANVD